MERGFYILRSQTRFRVIKRILYIEKSILSIERSMESDSEESIKRRHCEVGETSVVNEVLEEDEVTTSKKTFTSIDESSCHSGSEEEK